MNHVAIDLGGRESQLCIRQPDGALVEEGKVSTRRLPELMKSWTPCRVILETSAEAFHIADAARAHGHDARVVAATLVKALGVGARGIKTDQRDARVLSEVSCRIDLPSVHVPTEMARELKSMCGGRESLVETRTKLINNVRGWLRTQLWAIRKGAVGTFATRVRDYAEAQARNLPEHIERQLRVLDLVHEEVLSADRQVKRLACDHPVARRLMTVPGSGP